MKRSIHSLVSPNSLTLIKKSCIIEDMKELIYLDHSATTPLDRAVLEKMLPYMREVYGNADSPHTAGRKAMNAVDTARDCVADLICANANEVYFTSGGTESDNFAVLGGARAKRSEGKTRVVISAIEHHAVLFAGETLAKEGFEVVYLPVGADGRVSVDTLEEYIDDNTALVALMAVNNETGVFQPIERACALAHEHGALFFTDCVQYAPYCEIDVRALGADMLSFSAHKFYGPKGAGVLYIKNGVRMEKLVGGGEQERGMRGGTLNVAGIVGLAEAYRLARAEMKENNARLADLSAYFMRGVQKVERITRNGDSINALPSVLNLQIEGVENTAFLYNMDLAGVCLSAGSACASASVKPSHVLTAMGLTESQAKNSVRVSLGKNNTVSELDSALSLMSEIISRLRK